MPDNDLVLRLSHNLGSAEAKRRIAGAAAEVKVGRTSTPPILNGAPIG
jgi:hypothetical protein